MVKLRNGEHSTTGLYYSGKCDAFEAVCFCCCCCVFIEFSNWMQQLSCQSMWKSKLVVRSEFQRTPESVKTENFLHHRANSRNREKKKRCHKIQTINEFSSIWIYWKFNKSMSFSLMTSVWNDILNRVRHAQTLRFNDTLFLNLTNFKSTVQNKVRSSQLLKAILFLNMSLKLDFSIWHKTVLTVRHFYENGSQFN